MGPFAGTPRPPRDRVLLTDTLRQLPLLTAIAWLFLATLQVYRDRVHTWTERFFLFSCVFAGMYAISDWLFFNARQDAAAIVYVKFSLSSIALAEMFFLLFAVTYVRRAYRAFAIFVALTGLLITMVWTVMVDGVVKPISSDQLYLPLFRSDFFMVYLAYIVGVGLAGILSLYQIYRIVREQSISLARRTGGLVITFSFVLVLGLITNGYLGATRNTTVPPPFSSLLLPLAMVAMYTLYPGGRERISEAMRRFKARRYSIQSGFLIFNDGTLIGSSSSYGPGEIDRDLFSATLDVIQNFMRTSFPTFVGKSLRLIEHGDLKVLIERGKYCYLAIVLSGEENDLLRRQIRDELLGFEERNRPALAKWRGVQEDAAGTGQMLRRILQPPELFPKVAQ